ncbi:MAG: hypothetical protein IRZ08_13250 [Frankia sp.]|nr:hypothetical protein [Frankia sp.]
MKAGSRWRSVACETEVVVVRAADADVELQCGGHAMAPAAGSPQPATRAPVPGLTGGSRLGKRYVDREHGLEVLCTRSGVGSLASSGVPLDIKDARPLPSSD